MFTNKVSAIKSLNFEEKKLLNKLKTAKNINDSIKLYNELGILFSRDNIEFSKYYYLKSLKLINRTKDLVKETELFERLGDAYWFANNFKMAMDYYFKELRMADSLHNKLLVAKSKYNIGWIKTLQLKQSDQVFYFYEALDVFQKEKDTGNVILLYEALGNFYVDNTKSNKNFKDSALKYFLNGLKIIQTSSFKINECGCLGNLANYYIHQKEYIKAKDCSLQGVKISKENSNDYSYSYNVACLAQSYYYLDSIPKAKKALAEITSIIDKPGFEATKLEVIYLYTLIFEKEKNYKEAYLYSIKYKALSDSINEKTFNQNILQKENDYNLEQKDKALNELELKNQLQKVKNKNNSYVIIGLAIFGFFVLIILYFLFKSNQQKMTTNKILKDQNKIINEKKLEIEQSIQYAKGIQNAILPDINDLKKYLPDSFIFYLPKDVVSGDFYWLHSLSQNELLLAVADCTGHGVPGSLMSIVSMDKLNHSVFEKNLSQPNKILFSINNDIKNALKQANSASKQKDGLDIALLHFNTATKNLIYSGANRPLWIIRDSVLTEYKPTKSCIAGHTDLNHEFEQIHLKLQKNDFIIIFSDGYADQFGGNTGKKMMTKNFKELLITNSTKPISEIETSVANNFNNWKQNFEQVDDVLVIGFKIN